MINYFLNIIIMINVFIIVALSTNLLVGLTNLFSLAQAAFLGLGAYLTALAILAFDFSFFPTFILVILGTSAFSFIIALPSLRLKGDYFVLATLGVQLIIVSVFYNWQSLTRGDAGLHIETGAKLLGSIVFDGEVAFMVVSSILAIMSILIFSKLIASPFGRILKSMRDDEIAIASLGRNVMYFKVWVFIISSAFMGIAGMIHASYIGYIHPKSFDLNATFFILAMVIIGGAGNLIGPVVGAVFVTVLPEMIRHLPIPGAQAANLQQIIYGLCLVFLMYYRRKGIIGKYNIQ